MRSDDDACEDVAEHDRLLELPEENGDDPRDDHHNRKVLEKCDVMHENLVETAAQKIPADDAADLSGNPQAARRRRDFRRSRAGRKRRARI